MITEVFFPLCKMLSIMWSVADVFLIFFWIKFVNLIRMHKKEKAHKKLLYLLYFSFY